MPVLKRLRDNLVLLQQACARASHATLHANVWVQIRLTDGPVLPQEACTRGSDGTLHENVLIDANMSLT